MFKVLYYYYFLFYKKILKDSEPHLLTTLVLSFSESLIINGLMDICLAKTFCISLDKWAMLAVLAVLIGLNYLYYHKTGKGIKIVESKPMFFSSHLTSIILTILFFIVTSSFLFWAPIYVRQIIELCH